ncbi:MAG: hypothetical protein ACYCZ2_13600 [Lutibacter sp.]
MKDRAKYILPIILILLIGLGIFAYIKTDSLSDFGLNFATEIIGVLITVYIVDYLLKSREEARLTPMRVIVYQEISVLTNRFMGLLFELYSESVKENPPETVHGFIEENCIYKALLYSSIDGEPRISPPTTMSQYLSSKAIDFEDRAQKILDKYSNFMSPKIANILHKTFVESIFVTIMKSLPNTIQFRQKLPYPKSLLYHLYNPEDTDKTNLILLNSWLEKERKELLKFEKDLRDISNPSHLKNRTKEHKYIYHIPELELEKQIKTFEDWKTKSSNNV